MTSKRVSVQWTKHLKTDEERKEFEKSVLHDTYILGRLGDILEGMLKEISARERSSAEYDNPAWAYKQAHINGLKAGLTKVLELLP